MSATAVQFKNEGNAAFKAGSFEQAIALYTKSAEADPTYHVAYSNRSQAYYNKGDYQKAADDGISCTRVKPDWAKGYHRACNALVMFDDDAHVKQAWATLQAAYKNVGRGNSDLSARNAAKPKIPSLHEKIEAKWNVLESKRLNSVKRGSAQYYKQEGNKLYKEADYEKAIYQYDTAVKKCGAGDNILKAQCLNNCANCYKQLGPNYPKMIEVCCQVTNEELLKGMSPLDSKMLMLKVWYNLACGYKGCSKWKIAKDQIMQVLLYKPDWKAANQLKNQIDAAIKLSNARKAKEGRR